ncbi:homoserine kinase [Fulvivirgaceae bacterium BMA10]|uniref:Homoserine kinase n=1 Tax=Splendidivirga corallicola TaxID=3051826 RepID=A0ABT8KN10_9BACT|nr:homoserine kinase [Fulvivirgaceae bacterium BMA10]
MESIRVFAPATVANVTCGFDVLGFAVNSPGDEVILRFKEKPGIQISQITGDDGRLSKDPNLNTVSIAIQDYLQRTDWSGGIDIELHKKMPFGSGLGSSAASAVAGVFAINKLLGDKLDTPALLPSAMEGERVACGSAHADNVAPSLYGGFVIIRSYDPLDVIKIPTPKDLYAVIIHPQIEVNTKDARNILKKKIAMQDAIRQWGNVAGLIAGLTQSDYGLISRSMEDVIVEPVRSLLIPAYDVVKNSALNAGALGCGISGSGPSLFALSQEEGVATTVGAAMCDAFRSEKIDSEIYISKINEKGPQVLD